MKTSLLVPVLAAGLVIGGVLLGRDVLDTRPAPDAVGRTAVAQKASARTVSLDVPMSCPTCPYIVRRSLEGVPGVLDVSVSYGAQMATVRYDENTTTIAALLQATDKVGFPSTVASSE